VGPLDNTGGATEYTFSAKVITSVTMKVDQTSASTNNIGLSEIEVYGESYQGNLPPVADAGPDQTVNEGDLVYLDGSESSDPDQDPLTYFWEQDVNDAIQVTLSDPTAVEPSFTAPTGLSQQTALTFNLVVNDGQLDSAVDSVVITVLASQPQYSNIALLAEVTASSENTSTGQLAVKAVDGVADGYPGDYTKEWATLKEKSGAWIHLAWSSAYLVDRIILYDRPNTGDQILSATLSFSDGSTLEVGPLNNTGGATEYTFSAKVITSVTMMVDQASASTNNIGLSEIEVYGESSVPAELDHIEIEGPSEVVENTSAPYVCRAYYTNGTDHIVDTDTWAIDPPTANATISSSGILIAGEVDSNEFCQVMVSYTEGDVTDTDSYDVIITNYVPPELDHIEIEGPSEVGENTSATYVCRAYYTNGTDHIVDTDTWDIDPPTANATISSSGILTAGEVESDEFCQVMVSYTEGDVVRNASRPVTILDVVSPPEVIIDNGDDPGTFSTGLWIDSGGLYSYGNVSQYSKDAGATYTFEAALSGSYDVFLRWTGWDSRCTEVPVEIYDGEDSIASFTVDQQEGAAPEWNLVGTHTFSGTARVRVTAVGETCSTCVDAVRFVSAIPPELDHIEIEGPGQLLENNSATYVCRAYYVYGPDQIVNPDTWDVVDPPTPPNAEFLPPPDNGVLTAYEVDSDQPCHINVSYTEGDVTRTSDRKVIIKDFTGPTMENIYVSVGYNAQFVESKQNFIEMLQDIGATEVGGRWVYVNESIARTHNIYFVEDIDGMKQALMEEGAHVIFTGHSNYGHGPSFASETEINRQIIEDILYVDDSRIFNVSTEWINVSLRGMRTGQAYPFWRWEYQDGEDAKMPYDWGDPAGDPPYNYYLTYQVPGDPTTHYKIETVRRGAVERFSYSATPWFSSTGEEPDPGNPVHMEYYITNPESWYPSFETEGIWNEIYTGSGFFKENYMRTSPGDGSTVARFLFRIPEAGRYKIFGWWPALNNNTTNAPFAINHASGNTTVTMNQRINGGQWNELGEFDFNAQEYSVDLSNAVSSGNVMADGVRVAHTDNPPEIVRANFYARPLQGTAPLDVRFYNISTGDLTDREWDFGDGFTNRTRDWITHTYTRPGIYTVRLTVSGPMGSDTITRSALIWVDQPEQPLQAEFSASNRTGIYPLEVRFRDRSAGNITDWYWDFGDGTNSIEPDPTHEYSLPGIYTVSLTVSDSGTDETSTAKEDLVRVIFYDKNIDNVDYPKVHFSSKTILSRKELEIQPEEMRYTRMLYDSCNSGNYFLGTFHRGKMFYTLNNSATIAAPSYLRAYLEWKNNEEIWQTIQEIQPVYDYFDFDKPPTEQ
jgi:PKD repeat protein